MRSNAGQGMTLRQLQDAGVEGNLVGSVEQVVTGVQHDSRRIEQGDIFVAISGETHDGARFVDDALAAGAVAVIAEQPVPREVPQLTVVNARVALGRAAELVYGSPSSALHTVGITGTNGKTTTAYLLKEAIEDDSGKAALIGTTGLMIGAAERPSPHTTPEGDDISRFAREALDEGATHLVLEVSSHGLSLNRVDALRFEVAAFTNLSRDHLDYHGSLGSYGDAKARLFTELSPGHAVSHVDDAFGADLASRLAGSVIRCSRRPGSGAEILATEWSATRAGIHAKVDTPAGTVELRSPMLGEHNLENLLVALGCAHALGLDLDRVAAAWRTAAGSPGRLERIAHPADVAVLVDYAHTPDALERVLDTMRAVTPRRLIAVFGAGGDRDTGKRPEMGRVGVEHADLCVLTSDNPRTEKPQRILDAVEAGAKRAGALRLDPGDLAGAAEGYCAILDRREAIRAAIAAAGAGDTVLLAGKGHETYQVIGSERAHFDDREEARAAIAALGGGR
ncbi:MAG: UDP-N-acetylmuramoyl-L-alanyl-D-glutamate--2,6-diaminopimelate ligase [Myxococcales bacterium]|nr:MAG: UDP-N-acetylmuramoyl-L-alanyl-D-glutamate--2,6-diaminopimelate ligase [Myxococcales bacterium]